MKLAAYALLGVTLSFPSAVLAETPALLLFGGKNHNEFLGCVNCSNHDEASICNKHGKFGSEYEDVSIWNKHGTYGSKYNDESPWNKYSKASVAIVDREGGFYGYLTSNKYEDKRTTISALNKISDLAADSTELAVIRNVFCGL